MLWKMIGNSVNSLKHLLSLKGKFLYFQHGGCSYDFIQIPFDSLPAVHCKYLENAPASRTTSASS